MKRYLFKISYYQCSLLYHCANCTRLVNLRLSRFLCSHALLILNKKVLVRERKRHTARRVASPWPRRGGYLPWDNPHPDLAREVPTLAGGYLPWGNPPSRPGQGVPTLARGTYCGQPLPSPQGRYPRVWTDKHTETITFPHPTDAGGNKTSKFKSSIGTFKYNRANTD